MMNNSNSAPFFFFLTFLFILSIYPVHARQLTGFSDFKSSNTDTKDQSESYKLSSLRSKPAPLTAPEKFGFPGGRDLQPAGSVQSTEGEGAPRGEQLKQPVDLQADNLTYEESRKIVKATGNVVLEQAGRSLKADEVLYNLKEDKVLATGNVVLKDVNGDIHKAERLELQDDLKDGVIIELRSFLRDGSRFRADYGQRRDAEEIKMRSASYTPCEVCESNPDMPPVWQIKASEIFYDEEDNRIEYTNARFSFFGIPVFYTPYFAHFDGTVERRSGFLSPVVGFQSALGFFIKNAYYWDISPDLDATTALQVHAQENPLFLGQIRKNWPKADLQLDGGITLSERDDREAGERVVQDEELRGHFSSKGIWDINQKWRTGIDLAFVTDDQYFRQYAISGANILENEVYAERFSGRNYAVGRILTFQDLRIREKRIDQPQVLPEIKAGFIGEPGSVPGIGGRLDFHSSFLGLRRNGSDQDLNRVSAQAGWFRRLISDTGLLTDINARLRADFYNVRDRTVAVQGSGLSDSVNETRFFPLIDIQARYPLVKSYDQMQARISPVFALTVAGDVEEDNAIPNEDSQDIQIDTLNLFQPNRFPGLDAIEDESRITYGLRSGVYHYNGSHLKSFIGQSRRFDEGEDKVLFPIGSGLNEQYSDIVGELNGTYKGKYWGNYKFQFDQEEFSSQKHEVDFYALWDRFTLGGRYLFAKGLRGTDIGESREQSQVGVAYRFDEDWRTRAGAIHDFGQQPGLREAYLGLDYIGQCISWSLTGQKNLTEEVSGKSSTEIFFRIGLKNLGDFETSAFNDYLETDLRP